MGPFVGVVEIVCGTLIILGFLTRLASIPLVTIIVVAIVSTKVPILLAHDFWIFHVPKLPRYGLWSMLHEARLDFCMMFGALLPSDRRCRCVFGGSPPHPRSHSLEPTEVLRP